MKLDISNLQYSRLTQFANRTYPFRHILAIACFVLIRLFSIRVILVMGMSRSGTTFISNLLSLDNSSAYIHEPVKFLLQQKWKQENPSAEFSKEKERFWDFVFSKESLPFKWHAFMTILLFILFKGNSSAKKYVIKPITMIDSYEWLARWLNADVIFISRHPCGRLESLLRQTKFNGIKATPERVEKWGEEWGTTHKKARDIFERNPDWIWVKFEELCIEPIRVSKDMFEQLGLEWSKEIENEIIKMTNTDSEEFYGVNRDAQKQVEKWKLELSQDQIEAIRKRTLPYSTKLYDGF